MKSCRPDQKSEIQNPKYPAVPSPVRKAQAFAALTLLLGWAPWLTVLWAGSAFSPNLARGLTLAGAFSPMLAALLLWPLGTPIGLKTLFKLKAPLRIYAASVIGVPAAVSIIRLFLPAGSVPQEYLMQIPGLCLPFLILVPVVLGEELGWRGYLLPVLQQRFSFAWSTFLVGILWALWHFPLFFIGYYRCLYNNPLLELSLFTAQILCASVYLSWLYLKSGHRILIACLMHASINSFGVAATPGSFSSWQRLQVWLAAIVTAFLLSLFLLKFSKEKTP
jgi:membrane protease YdiL (CAAX protease family)